ncbi:MAG TPA: FG-GAP-like repeat-containing protein [Thermoanaerobaculia bacterium]|nr:FG-GAP-like repeat-containing protein [Thermoanaerobaculia bacterium]
MPKVSVSVSPGADPLGGDVVVTVHYEFPPDTGPRFLELTTEDPAGGSGWLGVVQNTETAAGKWDYAYSLSCPLPGTHRYIVRAAGCMGQVFAHATYNVASQPTVSISYSADAQGHGNLAATYDMPFTRGPNERSLVHKIVQPNGEIGNGDAPAMPERNGTWDFPFNTTCLPSGKYIHKVTANPCNRLVAEDQEPFTVDTKPEVSVQVQKGTPNRAVVSYKFKNTDSSLQRLVELRTISGSVIGQHRPATMQGQVAFDLPMCGTEDRLRARAVSCNREEAFAETGGAAPVKPKVTALVLTKGAINPATNIRKVIGTVHYDMGEGNDWRVRIDLLKWIGADGTVHPGGTVLSFVPATRTGKREFVIDPAQAGAQMLFRALATSCAGADKRDASIKTECGPNVASKDPVYFADGNVRVDDSDPLPPVGPVSLHRTYNSDEQVVALMGRGWTSVFDRRLILNDDGEEVVSIVTAKNEVVTFRGTGGVYRQTWPLSGSAGTLTRDAATQRYTHRAAGAFETATFDADGRLVTLRHLTSGREAQFTWDAQGLPLRVADSWSGTAWTIAMDTPHRRIRTISVEGGDSAIVWTYTYDAHGNLTTVTAPGNLLWRTYEFTANRMTASRDAEGHLIESHAYDENGFGISSTGPADEIGLLEYNLPGRTEDERVTRVHYRSGTIGTYYLRPIGGAYLPVQVEGGCAQCGSGDVTYVYDEDGRILREQGEDGYVTVRTYGNGRLASETHSLRPSSCDPATSADHCRLTTEGLAAETLIPTPATLETTFEYNDGQFPDRATATRSASVLQAGGFRVETLTFDAQSGEELTSTVSGWTGIPARQESRVSSTALYDGSEGAAFNPGGSFDTAWMALPQPRMRKSIDGPLAGNDDTTTFVYYPVHASVPPFARGRLAAMRNAAGHITRFTGYDVHGKASTVIDANGVGQHTTRDAFGRAITATSEGFTTTWTYTGAGSLKSEVRPGGGVTFHTYDARGRLETSSRGPSANDLRERVVYAYDPASGKRNSESFLAFENGGWAETRRVTSTFDAFGRLVGTQSGTSSEAYDYDGGHLAGHRDASHTTFNTLYFYDAADRLAAVKKLVAGGPAVVTSYEYDTHGNLTLVVDPNGNRTTYLFDDFGQMLRETSPVSGITTHSYDLAGNVITTTTAATTTTRTYDALGRALTSMSNRGGESEQTGWQYDAGVNGVGRLTSMTDPAGSATYRYDRRGLLIETAKTLSGTTYVTKFAYDADGNRSQITYPSGRTVDTTFDFAGRPLTTTTGTTSLVTSADYLPFGPARRIAYGNGTTRVMPRDDQYRMTFNQLVTSAGTLASYEYDYDGAGNVTAIHDRLDAGFTRTFAYDDLHRLVIANSGASLWGAGAYSYDAMGNLMTSQLGSRTASFAYRGTTPQLQSVTENGATRTVSYDALGNETLAGPSAFTYSPRNRLSSTGTTSFEYDGTGLRTTLTCTGVDAIAPSGATVAASVATGSFAIESQCGWTASTPTSWITLTAPASGAGNGSIAYTVGENPTTVARSGTIVAGSRTYTVTQSGAATPKPFRSDFDGDGLGDTLIRDASSGELRLLVKKGAQSRLLTTLPRRSIVAGTGDFWGDGLVSVVVFDRNLRRVSLWKTNGVEVVSQTTVRDIISHAWQLAGTGDFNGDGRSDLLLRNAASRQLSVWLMNGATVVSDPILQQPLSDSRWGVAALADFSGDGKTDILLRHSGSGALSLWEMNGTSVTSTGEIAGGPASSAWRVEEAADFDDDGRADILLRNATTSELQVWRMNLRTIVGTVTAGTPDRRSRVVAFEKFTADAHADVLLRHSGSGALELWESNGTSLTVHTPAGQLPGLRWSVEAPSRVRASAARYDYGGDGQADMLLRHTATNELAMWELSGRQVINDNVFGTVSSPDWKISGIDDMTGDRISDLVLQFGETPVAMWEMRGRTVDSSEIAGSIPDHRLLAQGDFDGDGNSDLLLQHTSTRAARIASIVDRQLGALRTIGTIASGWNVVAVGDFNGDGTDDLLLRNDATNNLDLWELDMTAGAAESDRVTKGLIRPVSSSLWKIFASADFNGDGMTDLLLRNGASLSIWEMNGRTVLDDRMINGLSAGWDIQSIADYNGDRQADVLLRHADGWVAMWEMNGRVVLSDDAFGRIASPLWQIQPVRPPSGGVAISAQQERATLPLQTPAWRPALSSDHPTFVTQQVSLETSVEAPPVPTSTTPFGPFAGADPAATLVAAPSSEGVAVAPIVAAGTARRHFIYSPELMLLAETSMAMSSPAVAYEYIWFGGQPLAQITTATNGIRWYFNDHLSTPLLQTDASASVVWRAEHEPYGTVVSYRTGATLHQPLRFPGQEAGKGSELYYNVYRWYRAGWGRYTQSDPIGMDGGDTNLYRYALSNPARFIDPSGLTCKSGKCSDCPKGQWDFVEASGGFGATFGKSWGTSIFQCPSSGLVCEWRMSCTTVGVQVGIGGGPATGMVWGGGKGCKCIEDIPNIDSLDFSFGSASIGVQNGGGCTGFSLGHTAGKDGGWSITGKKCNSVLKKCSSGS